MYLFCQKKYPGSQTYINQRRHIDICRKQECKHLVDNGEESICKCPSNVQSNTRRSKRAEPEEGGELK